MKKIILLGLTCFGLIYIKAQTVQRMSDKKASKWFNKMEWSGGLTLKPHPSINKKEFAYQYAVNKNLWDKAFDYLHTHDLANIEQGDYPLAGDSVVVKVTYGAAKEEEKAKWEAHKKFIDIQLVGKGKEKIGVADLAKATVTVPYNDEKDVANYTSEGDYYMAEPGTFFIFFPNDAHRPGIKVEEGDVRKIVVKIRVAE